MTFHPTRKRRLAAGKASTFEAKHGPREGSPRIAVSLPADDMRRLTWWARKKGKPVSWALREAVHCYLVPIAADADAEQQGPQS